MKKMMVVIKIDYSRSRIQKNLPAGYAYDMANKMTSV